MPEANESIKPFTLLGGILYLDEFELLPGLSANACRNIGRLRRKAVSAHLVGGQENGYILRPADQPCGRSGQATPRTTFLKERLADTETETCTKEEEHWSRIRCRIPALQGTVHA